jgi:predicted SnoaL-like aldol condensation-catalyzing enzyme
MTARNAAVVLRYLDEANNAGDVGLIDDLVAPDFRGRHGWPPTRDALREFVAWQRRTAPDWHIEVLDTVAEGDLVVVRAHASGTRTEASPGVPFPEPRRMEVDWLTLYRVVDGRIAEAWPYLAPG